MGRQGGGSALQVPACAEGRAELRLPQGLQPDAWAADGKTDLNLNLPPTPCRPAAPHFTEQGPTSPLGHLSSDPVPAEPHTWQPCLGCQDLDLLTPKA